MTKGVRTALIVVAIAAVVWALPSGDRSAQAVGQALSALIWAAIVLLGVRLYREGRGRIELLGDAHRLLLYGSLGLIVVAMAAQQDVVAAVEGGPIVLIAGVGALLLCFTAVAIISRLSGTPETMDEIEARETREAEMAIAAGSPAPITPR